MTKTTIATATAIALAAIASQANAQGLYVYGEAAYNDLESTGVQDERAEGIREDAEYIEGYNTFLNDSTPFTGDHVLTANTDDDDTDRGFGLGVGYGINKHLAVEFGYRDLGEAAYTRDGGVSGTVTNQTHKGVDSYESEALILRAVGILPVTDKFALEGLLGAAYVNTDYAGAVSSVTEPNPSYPAGVQLDNVDTSYSEDDSGFTATYGVGATYAFTDTLTGFARWERIHDIDTADRWGGIEVDTASAGVRYNF